MFGELSAGHSYIKLRDHDSVCKYSSFRCVCVCVRVCVCMSARSLKMCQPFHAQKTIRQVSHTRKFSDSNKLHNPAANHNKFCFAIFVQVSMKMHFRTEGKLVHSKSQETLSFYSLSNQLGNKNRRLPDVRWVNKELKGRRNGLCYLDKCITIYWLRPTLLNCTNGIDIILGNKFSLSNLASALPDLDTRLGVSRSKTNF